MKAISHKQAIQFIHRRLDGLLQGSQGSSLEEHLHACDTCRTYAHEMELLPARLQDEFHNRWDRRARPPETLTTSILTHSRKLIMSKRMDTAFNIFGGLVTLLVLVFVIDSVISYFRKPFMSSNESPADTLTPISTQERLIAFVAENNGKPDIYTMHPDGSGLTNLTNHPAHDDFPYWSPDGKRIAFLSNRNDPGGLPQLFVMNADGSQVTQLTTYEANHEFNSSNGNPWSPDGTKLLFTEWLPGDEKWILYSIDVDEQNKTPLTNVLGNYAYSTWSPDGEHVAFIALENQVTRIYSTDATGKEFTDVTKMLPADQTLYPLNYSWSLDGQSILFIATNWNYLLGGGGENSPIYEWRAYEASLDGNALITKASTRSQIGGYWWDGTYFLSGSAAMSSSPAFTWIRSDGTVTMLNPIKDCEQLPDSNTGGYVSGYSTYKQSPNGNVVIGAYCPNGDKWLFWADSKGTFRQLLNSPIHVASAPTNAMHSWAPPDFIWSADDKYIAFNIFTRGRTDMYILNVADALKDPSIQPFKITIGNGSLYYSPAWQPLP